jgi:hypothetical protein
MHLSNKMLLPVVRAGSAALMWLELSALANFLQLACIRMPQIQPWHPHAPLSTVQAYTGLTTSSTNPGVYL